MNLIFLNRRTDAAYLYSSRDKASFDVFWLRDRASKNPAISPLTLSQEIVQNLSAALEPLRDRFCVKPARHRKNSRNRSFLPPNPTKTI
jgi:hypothetical protein